MNFEKTKTLEDQFLNILTRSVSCRLEMNKIFEHGENEKYNFSLKDRSIQYGSFS